jgi:hypothetical protein
MRVCVFIRDEWNGLKHSSALDDPNYQYHDGNDKQNMNQAAHCVGGDHAEHPKYERNDDNSY